MLWLHASCLPLFALAVPSAWRAPLPSPHGAPCLTPVISLLRYVTSPGGLFWPLCFQLHQPQGPFPLFCSTALITFQWTVDFHWLILIMVCSLSSPASAPPATPPSDCSSTKDFSLLLHSGLNLCWFFKKVPQNQITNNYMFKQIQLGAFWRKHPQRMKYQI